MRASSTTSGDSNALITGELSAGRAPAVPAVLPQAALRALSRRLLLSFYWIVPLGIAVPLLDHFVLRGALQQRLPRHPDQLLLWTVIFNVPHLVASELLLLDKEYLRFYRRPLLWALGAVAVLWVACALVPPVPALWIATAITIYHVLGQQVGILRMMGGGDPGPLLAYYRLLAVFTAMIAYASLFPPMFASPLPLRWLTVLCLALLTLCFADVWRRLKSGMARTYLLANHVMFLAFVPLVNTGYAFFFLLMPRIVHDLSAFSFYVVHDTNRNRTQAHGLLYRVLGFTGLPPWILLPSASVGIGWVITEIDPTSAMHPVALISFFHYIMEAITWRRTGLHRHSIALA